MKQIVIGIVAFLGNYSSFSQGLTATDSISKPVVNTKPIAAIYPNPAKNRVELSVKGFDPGYVQLQITDMNGNKWRDDKRLLVSGTEVIVIMFSLQPGIYILSVRQAGKWLKKRLVVQ